MSQLTIEGRVSLGNCVNFTVKQLLTGTQRRPIGLLDLPAELWSYICQYVVVRDTRTDIAACPRLLIGQPALGRTCKVLRFECLRLHYANPWRYYTKNAMCPNALRRTLSRVPMQYLDIVLRSMIVESGGPWSGAERYYRKQSWLVLRLVVITGKGQGITRRYEVERCGECCWTTEMLLQQGRVCYHG